MANKTQAAEMADGTDESRRDHIVTRPAWAVAALVGLVLAIAGAFWQDPDPVADHGSAGPSLIDRVLYPVERNPMQRLAKPLGYMTAVHMDDDGRDVWVVGRGGSMMHSADGGSQWLAIDSHSESDLVDVRFVGAGRGQPPARRVGWAVGLRGEILTYPIVDDKGKPGWAKVVPKSASGAVLDAGDLFGIFTLDDGEKIWVLGNAGKLLQSRDGGRNWMLHDMQLGRDLSLQKQKAQPDVRSVYFRKVKEGEKQTGWAVGRGTILRTTDGGASWAKPDRISWPEADGSPETQWNLAETELDSIQFDESQPKTPDNKLEGWVTTRKGGLLHTKDGGGTWAFEPIADSRKGTAATPATASGKRPRLDFRGMVLRSTTLWLTASDGSIWYRDNRQGAWQVAATPTQSALRDITMDWSGRKGFAVGADGVILRTVDGGQIWADCTQGASAVLLAAHGSADGRKLWVAGHGGLMLASADEGKSWRRQLLHERTGPKPDLNDVTFLPNDQTGWAISARGHVYTSADGGQQWQLGSSDLDGERLRSIHVNPATRRLWVSGDRAALWTSSDDGKSWTRQNTGLAKSVNLLRVVFADGERGWAVGSKGTLIETSDGGRTWALVKDIPKPAAMRGADPPLLRDIQFDPTANRLWIVGDGGTILSTNLGPPPPDELRSFSDNRPPPPRWKTPTDLPTQASLLALRFDQTGKIGWAAGEGGVTLRTIDAGKTWTRAEKAPGSTRTALVMSSDGQRGWAFGYPDALFKTEDGGNEWEKTDWPLAYARLPAPWFWLVMLLLVGVVWRALSPLNEKAVPGAEAMGVTDAPTESTGRDRLDFAPLASGISRFLRNTHTEPPLTLAISGDWGTGKSSLMAMVCADLRRYGSRPVWFNAWHHQSEEQLLAALLTGIREHGLPSLFSLDGCVFRLRLFWVRSRKNFAVTLLVLLALSVFVGYLIYNEPTEWSRLGQVLTDIAGQLVRISGDAKQFDKSRTPDLSANEVGTLLPQLIALLGGAMALRKSLTPFGADPAVLARSTATNFKLRDASRQTGFRAQYAQEFREVTAALPYRLVVVIDDLDRCKPEAVQNVMEAVNFLVSSGQCFVLFGMSTPRVEAALALAFTSIAKELADMDGVGANDTPPQDHDMAERERRFNYVRDYLQKLINLEITLPSEVDMHAQPETLLIRDDCALEQTSWARSLWDQLRASWPVWLGIVVVAGGFYLGAQFAGNTDEADKPAVDTTTVAPPADIASKTEAAKAPARAGATEIRRPATAQAPSASINRLMPRLDADSATPPPVLLACGFVLIAGAVVAIVIYRIRTSLRHVQDTKEFKEALKIWLPLVMNKQVTRRATPRLIKRFGNRLRYLAMLQHDETLDHTLLDELQSRWNRLTGRADPSGKGGSDSPKQVLAEHLVVALGALHAVYGDDWRRVIQGPESSQPPLADARPPGRLADAALRAETRQVIDRYIDAIRDLESKADAARSTAATPNDAVDAPQRKFHWPPEESEYALFEKSLKGVRTGAAARAPVPVQASSPASNDPGLSPQAGAATA